MVIALGYVIVLGFILLFNYNASPRRDKAQTQECTSESPIFQ